MHPLTITSPDNPLLKDFKKLLNRSNYRRSSGKLAVEGPNLVREALAAGYMPHAVFYTLDFASAQNPNWLFELSPHIKKYLIPPELFSRVSDTEKPQGVAAIIPYHEPQITLEMLKDHQLVLILDQLQDPGNMGTIIRTAAAAGVDAVYYTTGNVDPYSPKVLRSTAGLIFRVKIVFASDLKEQVVRIQKSNMRVVACMPGESSLYWNEDYCKPTALVIGNESSGVSEEIVSLADHVVSIPQASGADSLNAAVAAALIMYEVLRQRNDLQ